MSPLSLFDPSESPAFRHGEYVKVYRCSQGNQTFHKRLGTPFSNLHNVSRIGVTVTVASGTLDLLYEQLSHNRPCIASVQTAELPHWPHATEHAIVVVGMDSDYVFVNDPSFEIAPILVPIGDFDLAWLAMDEDYAVFAN